MCYVTLGGGVNFKGTNIWYSGQFEYNNIIIIIMEAADQYNCQH